MSSSGQRLQLAGHTHPIRRLAVSPDGERVAAVAADDTLRIWDSTNGRQVAVFPVIAGAHRLFFTGDGRLVVTAKVREYLAKNPGEFDPRKYLGAARKELISLLKEKNQAVLGSSGQG